MISPPPCGPILIVEDDASYRTLLAELIERNGHTVVAAATGEEALARAREERPLAVVLDVCLPGLSGYEVCRMLREELGDVPIVFVSGERTESFDRLAGLIIGADDYLAKPVAADELLARLRVLLRRRVVTRARLHGLTPRELEVLRAMADGEDQPTIARRLVISPKTVGTHIEHIFKELGVRSRVQAVAAAYRHELVELEQERLPA